MSSTPQNDEEQQSWGQTTKDWRKLREKLMHLQHELSKYEKSEKSLKEEIATLKITNDKLESEIRKRTEIEDKFQRQNNEFTNSAFPKNNEQIDSNATSKEPNITEYLKSQSLDKQNNALGTSNGDMDPLNANGNALPLDIKELKDIAALVKRLQARSQQRQGE